MLDPYRLDIGLRKYGNHPYRFYLLAASPQIFEHHWQNLLRLTA